MVKASGLLAERGLNILMRCRHSIANVGLLGLMLSVGGCAVGPDFETPKVRVQNNWIEKHRLTSRNEVRYKEFMVEEF